MVSTSVSSASNSTGYNPYDLSSLYGASMAHDFFGSQVFGNSYLTGVQQNSDTCSQTQNAAAQTVKTAQNTEQSAQQIVFETPRTQASVILQQYAAAKELQNAEQSTDSLSQAVNSETSSEAANQQTTNYTPTVQDYYMAALIANQFSNNVPFISTNTSFTDNDYFAGKTFSADNSNSGLSYNA